MKVYRRIFFFNSIIMMKILHFWLYITIRSRLLIRNVLGCPISFFHTTLWMNLTGYVYKNMQVYLSAVYGIGFSCPRALSKYVSLVTKSLLKFFLHGSIWRAKKSILKKAIVQRTPQTRFASFTGVVLRLLGPYAIGLRNLELAISSWKVKTAAAAQQRRMRTLSRLYSLKIRDIVCAR